MAEARFRVWADGQLGLSFGNRAEAEASAESLRAAGFDPWIEDLGEAPRDTEPGAMFRKGDHALSGGARSSLLVDCSAATGDDVECWAFLVSRLAGPFASVEGVPEGGLRLAAALAAYRTPGGCHLVVDDVLTTGASLEAACRAARSRVAGENVTARDQPRAVYAAVVFARGPLPVYAKAVFSLSPLLWDV